MRRVTTTTPRWIEYLRLDALVPAVKNPKLHDLPAIVASLHRYGCAGALVLLDERTGRMVGGHGRVEGLVWIKEHGEAMPSGLMVDEDGEWLIPVERGWSSRDDVEAEAAIIALNQIPAAGGWHMTSLSELLENIVTNDAGLMETLGFDYEDIDNIIARVDPDTYLAGPTIDPPETKAAVENLEDADYGDDDEVTYERPTAKTHTCPSCGFDFKE